MFLPIYIYGSPVLRNESVDITKDYPDLDRFLADLWETMYEADGVGLAAPQVGRNIRVFVVDASVNADEDPRLAGFRKTFINARIYERSGEEVLYGEGCLSLPRLNEDVSRPARIAFRRTRRGVRRLRGPGDSARVRSPGRQAVRRSSLSVAQDADQGQAGRHGQRQVQGCLQDEAGSQVARFRSFYDLSFVIVRFRRRRASFRLARLSLEKCIHAGGSPAVFMPVSAMKGARSG